MATAVSINFLAVSSRSLSTTSTFTMFQSVSDRSTEWESQ